MALSDADVQKQIKHMMAFIDQEANEKAEEIDAKAEEEFNIEKGRLVQEARVKVMESYDRKEKQIELQKKTQNSSMMNASRLQILKARQDHVQKLLEEGTERLSHISRDKAQYKQVLQNLIVQALFQLLEAEVIIRCREVDVELVQSIFGSCEAIYKEQLSKLANTAGKALKMTVKLQLDKSNYLPPRSAGGVELFAPGGKIMISNTLENRLQMIGDQMLPDIKETLFGVNPNRKFLN